MGCAPAASCRAALAEATRNWPNRRRTSDGICGDPRHQARKSDHNAGNAWDLSHDPAAGCDAHALVEGIRQRKDPRVKYIISNRRITGPGSSAQGFDRWVGYSGSNPHTSHAHVSIWGSGRDNTMSWFGSAAPAPPPAPAPGKPAWPGVYLREGSKGDYVRWVQSRLNAHSPPSRRIRVDGDFGPVTGDRVGQFQQAKGLHRDEIVGRDTWNALA